MSNLNKESVEVQCTRPDPLADGTQCVYRWNTRTKLKTVSCPNCRYPNNTEKAIEKAKENPDPLVKISMATSHRPSQTPQEVAPDGEPAK